ncbi:MAG: PIN domain-containing protein [Verrucomicrobia bacterium]|jgi:PIN domain nuclease of toxin-antitoxin system|nr:PIN domain-containing protein [Verrucomicrobiota bacterium]
MISHVLDTCALLDLTAERWSDQAARMALERSERPVLLCVSIWEISRKFRLGKLSLPCELSGIYEFMLKVCQHHQIEILMLDGDLCHRAELLPPHHEDPFDRMIIALASKWDAPVFTTDRRFEDYPVNVIRQW